MSPVNVWEEGAQAERRARAFPWEISGAEQSEGERKDIEGEGYLLQKTGCEDAIGRTLVFIRNEIRSYLEGLDIRSDLF